MLTDPPIEALNLKNNGGTIITTFQAYFFLLKLYSFFPGNTPLLMCTIGTKENLCKEIVTLLIDAKVDVNAQNKLGKFSEKIKKKKTILLLNFQYRLYSFDECRKTKLSPSS